MKIRSILNADISNKNVILRADFNVPIVNSKIIDSFRIDSTLDTINFLKEKNCKIIILSHFGRPKHKRDQAFSLMPVYKYLKEKLGDEVSFISDCIGEHTRNLITQSIRKIILLENIRFYHEEETNDKEFAKELAKPADIYVNEAFGCCHRKHASICQLPELMPSYAGLLLTKEIQAIEQYINNPKLPMGAIIAGAKVSTKLTLLYSLLSKVNKLFIAGAMANSFLKAINIDIGFSIYEEDMIGEVKNILQLAKEKSVEIVLPVDFKVAKNLNDLSYFQCNLGDTVGENKIFDIGNKTVKLFTEKIIQLNTIVWNGPVGVFETKPYDIGTISLAKNIAQLTRQNKLISIIGGGESAAVINQIGLKNEFTHVSTGGGAFLASIEGKLLPGIKPLVG